ncbi:hypothetical protein SeMB42_g00044 [Synchytrium endobioticum]|uniref:Ubiquitin-like domain-containing protein n=1 Tax=Synchytrium endobioticum TaxID=286115 RepID=A0A507D7I1_9FUNG|nr:hypothetical protein SeLEV6574_g02705 [Synchytrium endobioticum]TPX55013.1 hypothetical protein SeMB42_g00044 [Synchytrium endobioticum]
MAFPITSAVRIKRHKTTYFISTSPSATIADLKQDLVRILSNSNNERSVSAASIRLYIAGKAGGSYSMVDDAATLEQLSVADDGVLYMALPLPGTEGPDAKWEPIEVPEFEPLGDDEGEEGPEEKGKEKA